MKGKHAKALASPKRMRTRDLDEEQQYSQILSKAADLFQERILQDVEIQELIKKAQQQQYEELQPSSKPSFFGKLIQKAKQLTKKQVTAFSTLTIMLTQMFSPYTALLSTVQAAVDPSTDTLVVVSASPITEGSSGNKIVEVTYALTGDNVVGFDFNIGYDPTKIKPAWNDGSGDECEEEEIDDTCATIPSARNRPTKLQVDRATLSAATNIFRITMSHKEGGIIDLTTEKTSTTGATAQNEWGYSPYLPVVTLHFYLVDDSITQLDDTMLFWKPVGGGMPTGFKYIYDNGGGNQTVIDAKTSVNKGFAEPGKEVSSIEVTTMPTDLTYKNGEQLNFTGGVITIHYDDPTLDETKNIVEGIEDGSITVDTQYASNTTKKAVITYSGKIAEIPYYVLSGAMLRTTITKTTYDHGDNLDFTGGEIDAIFTNSSGAQIREEISIPTGLGNQTIETNTTTADVNKNPVKLTYEGYTVDLPLTVNDPLDHITVNPPTKITYEHGDNISFAGGSITTYTKSGATAIIPATDAGITIEPTTADINTVINSWTTPSGLTAGTEEITVKYQGKSAKYNITVNDTIDSINVTKQPTAKNKYGETNPDFTGLEVTVTTAGGGSFTVDQNSVSIDKSGYNPNTLTEQQFTVTYGGKTSTTKAKLTLQDYITDIIPTFPTTTFEYDTPVATVINGATYVKKYKSGATGTAEPITAGMISGYTQRPAPTLFNSSHEASQTISIKLTNGTNSFDEVPITKTQAITIKDKITGITVDTLPSKTSFKYGDAFEYTNGKVKTVYASGAQGNIVYMSDPNVKLTQTDGTTPVTTSVAKSKFSNGKATETVKVTYTKDGKNYDTTYPITILDKVTGISITTDPTKVFEHGATFGVGSGKITVNYAVADPQIIPMSDNKVKITQTDDNEVDMSPTTYDANHQYTEHLKVEYMGETATYDITITNVITGITLKPSPKTSYTYKEPITNAGGSIEITRKNGTTSTLPITDSMITGLNTDTVGTRQATVTYTENGVTKTAKYSYTVENSVTGVTITAPSKTIYKHGESLAAGKVTLTYADGTTSQGNWSDVTITDGGTVITALPTPTEAEYKASSTPHKISKTLKLNYTKDGVTATEVSYPIEIINDVKSIAMYQVPKQTYSVNDPIDVTGGEIMVTRAVGTEAIAITKEMTSGFDSSKEYLNNSLTITVTYTENNVTPAPTTSYKATVTDTVASIKITKLPKQDYKYNEPLDATAGKLEITRSSGQKVSVDMTNAMVSGYRPQDLEEQTLTVTYGGQTTTYTVTVKDYVTGITVSPTEVDGTYNQELADLINNKNIKYTVNYAKAGALQPVAPTENMVTGYNKTDLNARNITITYTDNDSQSATNGDTFTATIKVTTPNVVTGATIVAPTDGTYQHGEPLKTGTVTLTYADGTTSQGNWSDVTITDGGTVITALPTPTEAEYKASSTPHKISKTLKLNYTKDGVTATEVEYPIEIINDVKSIAMYQVPKQTYSVNDPIDVTGGEIMVTRAVGSEAIAITKEMTSGFDSSKEYLNNSLTITVTYTENNVTPAPTTSYKATVTDTVASIKITKLPKQDYKYDEPLDATAGKLELTRASGDKEEITMTNAMVSGYNPQQLGKQTLTITYGGQTATYEVNVKDYVTGITVNPDNLNGTYNTSLADLIQNVKYQVTYKVAGAQPEQNLTEAMVSGYTPTSIQTQNLTVTYVDTDTNSGSKDESFTANLTVTLSNGVTGARITKPTNAKYKHGESLEAGILTLMNADGTETTGDWSDVTITEADGSNVNMTPTEDEYKASNHKISKTLKLNYSKDGITATEVEYPIEIINDIKSIAMYATPKQNYSVNDPIDVTGGEIMVTRAVGTEAIAITKEMTSGFDSSQEYPDNSLTITVTYTENGVTPAPTTSYTATVTDTVSSITMGNTPKTNYKYNEPLDTTGGTLTITRASGETKTVDITNAMIISTFDPQTLGEQTLTVTYGGQTTTYTVTVKDYVTGITVTPTEVDGTYNQELADLITNKNIMYTVNYAKAGALNPEVPTESMVTGYNKTDLGDRDITITYTDNDSQSATNGETFSATVTVKTPNGITGAVITAPTNTTYKDSESLAEGTITFTYANGDTTLGNWSDVTITNDDGTPYTMTTTEDEYKANNHKISKVLKLNYNKDGITATEVEYPIEIINDIKSIAISTVPKQDYNIGDTLDVTNGEILVTRAVGTENIAIVDTMVSGFDTTAEHKDLSLKVEYTENGITKETNYTIQVKDDVSSVTLKTTPKTDYLYGEPLDISGGELEITRPSGNVTIPLTMDMITSTFDPQNIAEQTVTIEYGGFTVEYQVNVKDYMTGIVLTPPTKTEYEYGEALDLTGGTVQKVMASGAATTPVDLSDTTQVTLGTYDPTKEGAQTITVEYAGEQASFAVTVVDNVQTIAMVDTPKQNYKYGEPLDINGGTILVTRSSGRTETIDLEPNMVTGFNPNQLGQQTLTITYKGKETNYTVDVEDYVTDIAITRPDKEIYALGEELDLTGANVKLVMASGIETAKVDITADMISGFDTSTEGPKLITVTYQGFTKEFSISVMDSVSGMILTSLPDKIEYLYGESLDLTGGTIAVVKESGQTSIIPMTMDMISGYSPNILGTQIVTVTYEGQSHRFIVTVNDYVIKLQVTAPTKTSYEYGEELDLEGGRVGILMASGIVEQETPLTASMLSVFDNQKVGKQTIKVEYKGLQGNFQVTVKDQVKGISMKDLPNKVEYEYGERLDVTGATIHVIKSSGTTQVKVTNKMVSGFNPRRSGAQVITVTYEGMKTQFVVAVNARPQTQIVRPVTPTPEEPVQEPEKPVEKPAPAPTPKPEKPTAVLGEKDEDNGFDKKMLATVIGGLGILLLLILLAMRRRNVKIYVEEDGEFVLAGTDKLTRKDLTINIDQYLDGENYHNKVMICLNDSISDKLDEEEIEIKHRGEIVKEKIKYLGEPVDITLE